MRPRATLACALLVHACLIIPAARAAALTTTPPAQAVAAVCRPEFGTAQGKLAAGTAFVVRSPMRQRSPSLLVTAHHLFGPDGGVPKQVAWKDLPAFVRSVRCAPLTSARGILVGGRALAVRDARPYSEAGSAGDVAVFRLHDSKARALDMRLAGAVQGQNVFLAARVAGGEPPEKLLHGATIVGVSREWVDFAYDNPTLDLTATSGAPVVDQDGRVVGINIGVRTEGKTLIGVAQSAAVVISAMERALAAPRR